MLARHIKGAQNKNLHRGPMIISYGDWTIRVPSSITPCASVGYFKLGEMDCTEISTTRIGGKERRRERERESERWKESGREREIRGESV